MFLSWLFVLVIGVFLIERALGVDPCLVKQPVGVLTDLPAFCVYPTFDLGIAPLLPL